jgi:hypothetical protein
MSYIINKTDGTRLTEIIDGSVDQIASELTLIGKSASSYGEHLNENLVHMLENFANATAPTKSIVGQLWFDTIESRLKVYDGSGYKITGGTIVSDTHPSSLSQGDIWINNATHQLYFNDGTQVVLAGPDTPEVNGFLIVSQTSDTQDTYEIIKITVQSQLFGVISNVAFNVDVNNPIPDFDSLRVEAGLNLVSPSKITNVDTSSEDLDAVNNVRLLTAIKQKAPYGISLDISSMPPGTDTDQNYKIGVLLGKIFPIDDFKDNTGDDSPICRVLCTKNGIRSVRTFQLGSDTTDGWFNTYTEDVTWN